MNFHSQEQHRRTPAEEERLKDQIDAQAGQLVERRSRRSKAVQNPASLEVAFRNMSIQEILVSMDLRKMADAREH